jgi:hypothetical protein
VKTFNLLSALVLLVSLSASNVSPVRSAYLGFDRNHYPGDNNLAALRKTFSYAGYWLNNPPGETLNTWTGKRQIIAQHGFGFLVLFNGRLYNQLKKNALAIGKSDAANAVATAKREGFALDTIIFIDQEQGGRMLPEQRAYLHAWIDGVSAAGFRAGVYCSGIPAEESLGHTVITAEDIKQNAGARDITYFVTNDACPPSPGCAIATSPPQPSRSGVKFAEIWQFAQSPKRPDIAAKCPANYNRDGNCYAPGINPAQRIHVDLDTATSPNPSNAK